MEKDYEKVRKEYVSKRTNEIQVLLKYLNEGKESMTEIEKQKVKKKIDEIKKNIHTYSLNTSAPNTPNKKRKLDTALNAKLPKGAQVAVVIPIILKEIMMEYRSYPNLHNLIKVGIYIYIYIGFWESFFLEIHFRG